VLLLWLSRLEPRIGCQSSLRNCDFGINGVFGANVTELVEKYSDDLFFGVQPPEIRRVVDGGGRWWTVVCKSLINGVPRGIRTPVTAVKGRCPRPG
jgi:hypothetical protein